MSTLTLQVSDEVKQRLDALSRERNQPVDALIQESVRRYLAQEELRLMREKLRPYAEAQGFLTDEDVFKVVS